MVKMINIYLESKNDKWNNEQKRNIILERNKTQTLVVLSG